MTQALETVSAYAFATETLDPGPRFPYAFTPHPVPRYGYRTYDCVPSSPGPAFTDLDLLVSAGLNADLNVRTLVRLRSFADRAAEHLEAAHRIQPDFLLLPRDELGDSPPQGTAGWHLHEAWRQGTATPGLKVARVHKVLHHKRPRLVPLLDNWTIAPIDTAATSRGCTAWQQIHDEIHAHAEQFRDLAAAFDQLACGPGDVSLSHLRLYDILIWMSVRHLPG
ncbi:DUF6308 family protein [Catellatospora paridis]|uniref:DUF6308 family protein n=1 Tax=Catellatospora paridis TaxID=1617086 RepID=UPI0012D42577|nr:DUF6308 family protein [Catellatospora paridis]